MRNTLNNAYFLTIPEGQVKSISHDEQIIWTKQATNWVPLSIETNGSVYNGGLGYKAGTRVRSGGAESSDSGCICTGFIPFKKGDTLRIVPPFGKLNVAAAINFSDANFTNLGQVVRSYDNGQSYEHFAYGICADINIFDPEGWTPTTAESETILTLTATNAADVAYIRVTNSTSLTDGSDFFIAVNEQIK
jgi:hypothetical protein